MYFLGEIFTSVKQSAIYIADTLIGYEPTALLDLLSTLMLLLFSTAVIYLVPVLAVIIMMYIMYKLLQPIIEEGAKDGLSEDDFVSFTSS